MKPASLVVFLENISSYKEYSDYLEKSSTTEGEFIDFKESFWGNKEKDNKEIRKDFSAFANTFGGIIFLGVDDNKKTIGINNDINIEQSIASKLHNNALKPNLQFRIINRIKITDDRYIIIIYIPRGRPMDLPYISDGKIYRRENTESIPISHPRELDLIYCPEIKEPQIDTMIIRLEMFLEELDHLIKGSPIDKHIHISKTIDKFIRKATIIKPSETSIAYNEEVRP